MDAQRNAEPIRVIVERSINGASTGNSTKLILKLISVDHHFVPTVDGSDEDLQIKYKIRGLSERKVLLRISSQHHNPQIIYERKLTKEEKSRGNKKIIRWNGETNCTSGPLQGKLVNPISGDLKVQLVFRDKVRKGNTKKTRVLYRKIQLEPLSWLEAYKAASLQTTDNFPLTASDDIKKLWIQYRLNELGYVAGPLVSPPNDNDIMRALFRYTQAHPDQQFPKIYEFQTLQAGAAGNCGWGWKAIWDQKYAGLDNLCQGTTLPAGLALLNALINSEQPRPDVFTDSGKLAEKRLQSRVILDHDIYYFNNENTDPDAHTEYDKEFLNKFSCPIRVKVQLVSRKDPDAKAEGVFSPEAVGPVHIEWRLFDPPENMVNVPMPVTADVPADFKSKTRNYLQQTQMARAGSYGNKINALDNCPEDLGGVRTAVANDVTKHFFAVPNACSSVSPDTHRFISIAKSDAPKEHLGTVPVFFQGSYIAGDNYTIQARLVWDQIGHGDELKAAHHELVGLSRCFDPQINYLGMDKTDPMIVESLRLTIWRRHHILQEIIWSEMNYQPIKWEPVVRNFEAAHIILVPPTVQPQHIENVFLQTTERNRLLQALKDGLINGQPDKNNKVVKEFEKLNNSIAFHREAFYPMAMPVFNEISPSNSGTPTERFQKYALYLDGLRNEYPTYGYLREFFLALRKEYDKLGRKPGLLVLRGALFPHPGLGVPNDVSLATQKVRAEYKYPYRAISTGGDHGIVFLDEDSNNKFEETFFTSHEIGHSLFLTHLFQFAGDHDNDQNCIMTYNSQNGGASLGWASKPESIPTKFSLSVSLYANKSGIPSYGKVSGKFERENPKSYLFEGTSSECEKALRSFEFTPDRKLDQDLIIELKLNRTASLPPSLSVKLPYSVNVGSQDRSLKPFETIRVTTPNPTATQPFFCGKCLLKLRGWKVRDGGINNPIGPNIIAKSKAVPVNPRMESTGIFMQGGVIELDDNKLFHLNLDSRYPNNQQLKTGPLRFLHPHNLSWESSDGNLASLSDVFIREHVKFNKPTQSSPFNVNADEDQEFYQVGTKGDAGSSEDTHSIRLPALVCDGTTGTHIGQQWYQYSLDGQKWENIEGAAFIIEKTVYQGTKGLVLKFKKINWLPYNKIDYNFEIHYSVGPLLNIPVKIYNVTPEKKQPSVGAVFKVWGGQAVSVLDSGNKIPTTEKELNKQGFLAPKPWL